MKTIDRLLIIIFILACVYAVFIFPEDVKEVKYQNLTKQCQPDYPSYDDWYIDHTSEPITGSWITNKKPTYEYLEVE